MAKKSTSFLGSALVIFLVVVGVIILVSVNGLGLSSNSETECGFARLNQEKSDLIKTSNFNIDGDDLIYTLHVPLNVMYKKAEVVKSGILFQCEKIHFPQNAMCTLAVNGVNCTSFPQDGKQRAYRFEGDCLNSMSEGVNEIKLIVPPLGNASIYSIWTEMSVLPSNC